MAPAAPVRPDPKVPTEKEPPPSPLAAPDAIADVEALALSPADRLLLQQCGVTDLGALAARCQQERRRLGQPTARWATPRLVGVLRDAVLVKGWPAASAAQALVEVAADPATLSPTRLSCPGPWWDRPTRPAAVLTADEKLELDRLETRLREADGRRVWLQQRARTDLQERGEPVTRLSVARRACQLLDDVELTPC